MKKWDAKLVHIISALHVEYMFCETVPENGKGIPRTFKLKTDKATVSVVIKIGNMKHEVQVKMIQFQIR